MIFSTKCPHCQTTFRVTEDQLKLYNGTVRCGVCQQIFNGTDHLQTEPASPADSTPKHAEKNQPPPAPAGSETALAENRPDTKPAKAVADTKTQENAMADITIDLTDEAIHASSESEALFDALEEELSTISLELGQVTGQLFGNTLEEESENEEGEVTASASSTKQPFTINEIVREEDVFPKRPVKIPATRSASLSLHPDLNASPPNTVYSTAPRMDDIAGTAPATAIEAETMEPDPLMEKGSRHHAAFFEMAEEDDADEQSYASEPHFAKRKHAKKRSGFFSSLLLSLATTALFAILLVQFLYMFSDRIVVWWPPAESAVAKACDMFSCPRRLETRISSLSIESSELQIISPLTDKYALSALIRNSSSSYQSWPHIELTLTDSEKKPVMRRAFAPANYLPDAERITRGIPPYSEESIRLYLEMEAGSSTDYRISLFYP